MHWSRPGGRQGEEAGIVNISELRQSEALPYPVRVAGRHVLKTSQMLTSPLRALPDFMIIGVQRGGTTTLFRWLSHHPEVQLPHKKEIHYFDNQFSRPLAWYRSHFPVALPERMPAREPKRFLTGEASPYYLFHPNVPARVATVLPRVKVIVLLRNPVDRAYSHYQHEFDHGDEPLSFTGAIATEPGRLRGEEARLIADPSYRSFAHQHHSYLSRGIYIEQLERWNEHVPRERMLVLKSEDLYSQPASTIMRVTRFLALPDWNWDRFQKHNALDYDQMDPRIRRQLQQYFAPHNERLYDYLGVDFGWDA